jgi:tetratricopeptide (TPR) repeat protein
MVGLLLGCAVLAAAADAEGPGRDKPPWQRLLQGDDASKAERLEQRLQELQEAEKFSAALEVAEELAALRSRVQGADHWEAVDARFAVEAVRKAARAGKEDKAAYAESFSWERRVGRLAREHRYREAQALLAKVLAVRLKVLGEEHPETARLYNTVASLLKAQGRDQEAEEALLKALAICQKTLGEEHPHTATCYNNVATALHAQDRDKQAEEGFRKALAISRKAFGEEHAETAVNYHNVADSLEAQGLHREAEESFRKALAICRKALGEEHPHTAICYDSLAGNLRSQGRYKEAEEDSRKALAIRRKLFGEEDLSTAHTYDTLAANLDAQGRYREAEEGRRKALAIRRKLLGDEHSTTATSYNNVALNLDYQGRHREAEEIHRKALDIKRKVLGEDHDQTATSYHNLAFNLNAQGRYREAEAGYQKALDIFRKTYGEKHRLTATCYNSVAFNLNAEGRYKEADAGYRKALEIRREVFGEQHPNTADSYNNVAANLTAQGHPEEAEAGFKKALAIRRKVLGEDHPDTALSYYSVAGNLNAQGRYREAEEQGKKALAIRRKVLGEDHPDTAMSYHSVAFNLHAQGRYQEAEEVCCRGAGSFLASRLQIAASGLGRMARTSEHSPLLPLAALLARNGKPAAAWQRLEQGLGRGAGDDLAARLRRPSKELARQTELLSRLERLDQLLAQQLAVREPTPAQKKERDALLDRRLAAQEELTRFAHYLEDTYGPAEGKVFDRQTIQAALPEDTALVAWIDIAAGPKAADPNGEHWAVLLRSQEEPIFERLRGSGPAGNWTAEDTDLPAQLRTALGDPKSAWRRLARKLGELRLGPLRRHLAAVQKKRPAVHHLVVLPSTALAGVPLEVLDEDYTVSHALSGTLYAHLRKQPATRGTGLLALGDPVFDTAAAAKPPPLPPGGLLLTLVQPGSNAAQSRLRPNDVLLKYGDVELKTPADLKAALAVDAKADISVVVWCDGMTMVRSVRPGPLGVVVASDPAPTALAERYRLDRTLSSRRGDDGWGQLPGTRVEVESLHRLFGEAQALLLFDSEASEQRLDQLAASGELGKYRYLHLATHGEIDDAFPLRSALILSRDTLPDPQQQLQAGKPVYDGRLTAEEMLRSWNLNADLVTLSACQTGLGKYERGEGFVGFAQALILCGSRSVCLSLWKVDDAATALLMQRFYANLLGKREGLKAPLPKAAALREAKEWLRTLPRAEALRVAAAISSGVARGKGRPKGPLLPAVPEWTPETKEDCPYAHPYYWAAFVLIGSAE